MGEDAGQPPLDGMVALVSGGSRGFGRLLGARLAQAGAAVGLIARSAPDLAAVVSEIGQADGTVAAACADITDERAVAAAVNRLRDRLGPAGILINNAGISGPIGPAWDVPAAEWRRALEVNLGGAFILTQVALTHMVAAGRGRIINITSNAGVYRWPLMSAYASAKAALVKLTETLAEETRPHGVSVFSVDPGLLPIGLSEAALSGPADPRTPAGRVHRWITDQFDAGRGADPERAAALILALASGDADRLSGRHLRVSDDLEALLTRIDEIGRDDLHTLRLRTSACSGGTGCQGRGWPPPAP
jgi:NAD(P)-dependent dehydrogenase (short-subunit alcohol dehydrogenase family)